MKIPAIIISFILLCIVEGIAGTPHQFQAGKLVDVGSDERAVEGTTIIHAVYQVQVGDLIYFARGERVRRHSGDPAHGLVVGDPVQLAIARSSATTATQRGGWKVTRDTANFDDLLERLVTFLKSA